MYYIVLFACILAIIVFNLIIDFTVTTALYLLWGFAVVLLPSLLIFLLIRLLPSKLFDYQKGYYQVSEKERDFYNRINVKNWKDKIPNFIGVLRKNNFNLFNSDRKNLLTACIKETCYAETLHILCIFSALIFMWIFPPQYILTITLPITVVYVIYNIPSIMVQRYNRPRLVKQLEYFLRESV